VIDPSRHIRLLKALFYVQRLTGLLPGRHGARWQAESYRAVFYEKLWREAAAQVGASFVDLGYGIFEIERDGERTRVFESTCPLDDPVTLAIAGNKPLVYRLLAEEGLPVPRHVEFTLNRLDRAVAFLDQARGNCVVKPANGAAGWGVTTGIRGRWQLARATLTAAAHGGAMLVEEQVTGDNYRLLYLDGVLLDAVVRRPPTVIGDGKSTIRQLVEAANAARLARKSTLAQVLITVDLDMRNSLSRQGLALRSVPAAGAMVNLKMVINQNLGADNETATALLCNSVIAEGARAARLVGARLAGVDVITPDPSVPLVEAGGVILEVNTTPGYHHHYHKKDGTFPVAVRVLEQLLGEARPSAASTLSVPA
jgi:cyanophycin synthetase